MSKPEGAEQQLRAVPKHIAGVKLSKPMRKSAAPLYAFLNRPLVSDALAAALVAAAGALAKREKPGGIAKAAALGAGAAAVKASKGANRLGLALLILTAELAVGALARQVGKPKKE